MKFSLVSIAAAVASAFAASEAAVKGFVELKDYAVQLMDAAESTYTADVTAGATKLQSVLAATKAVAVAIGVEWSTGLEAALVTFISAAKGAFNAVSGVAAEVVADAPAVVATAEAAVAAIPASVPAVAS